jgi:hypothetical protein
VHNGLLVGGPSSNVTDGRDRVPGPNGEERLDRRAVDATSATHTGEELASMAVGALIKLLDSLPDSADQALLSDQGAFKLTLYIAREVSAASRC